MKILIIRLSSFGDIILTTPVIRCVKKQLIAEVHFLVKKNFSATLSGNPYIDKIHMYESDGKHLIKQLKSEKYDQIIDLHKNIRSKRLILALGVHASSFDKLNLKKWIMTAFKINLLPTIHIVDRYFEAVKNLGVKNDEKGLDFFISDVENSSALDFLQENNISPESGYICMAIGSAQQTKVPPLKIYTAIISKLSLPVVLLGGPLDTTFGEQIKERIHHITVVNAAGRLKLVESVACIKYARCLITPDTGLMHAGAAVNTPMSVIWGNTIPEFGMSPYYKGEHTGFYNEEVKGLSCRPCSKIGYKHCPKGHFKCMNNQNISEIADHVNKLSSKFTQL